MALTALKGVLVIGTSIVCNLNATSAFIWVLKQVHIGTLIKAMVSRLHFFTSIEIMNVAKALRSVNMQQEEDATKNANIQRGNILFSITSSHNCLWTRLTMLRVKDLESAHCLLARSRTTKELQWLYVHGCAALGIFWFFQFPQFVPVSQRA